MESKRLKIAYITPTDARDKRSWSGVHYSIWKTLDKQLGDVELIGPVQPFFALWVGKIITGLSQKILHKRYNYRHSRLLAKGYAKIVNRELRKNKYDLIVVPATSTFIPYLNTEVPIVYIGDATVQNTMDYYPALSNLYRFSRKETIAIEQEALNKCSFLIYSSAWAGNSAIHDFKIPSSKVFIIPFGANLENIPSREKVLSRKKNNVCRLLFLGVDWKRKGGAIAFDALIELNKSGIETQLTVCGCAVPNEFKHPNLNIVPFLDKNKEEQREQYEQLFFNSDFVLLPTRMECYGITFCEASVFGVPSISTNTGGVSAAVIEGINGFLLPPSAIGKEYSKVIADVFTDDEKYYSLAKSSRDLFETTLNWDKWGEGFKEAYWKIKDASND